jgi:hypothetical protein
MKKTLYIVIVLSLFLSACGAANSDAEAARAVEDYLTALTNQEPEKLTTLSCADWEEDALFELDSFAAVATSLDSLSCQVSGEDGDAKLVNCTGSIQATYGNELQQFDLSPRTFRVVNESGEWLMCGYK